VCCGWSVIAYCRMCIRIVLLQRCKMTRRRFIRRTAAGRSNLTAETHKKCAVCSRSQRHTIESQTKHYKASYSMQFPDSFAVDTENVVHARHPLAATQVRLRLRLRHRWIPTPPVL